MTLKNFYVFSAFIFFILSIVSIVFAIRNKDITQNKYLIRGNLIFILYFFLISFLLHNLLPILIDLDIFITNFFLTIFGVFLCIISIVICIIKKKRKKLTHVYNPKSFKIFLTIVFAPIIIFILVLFRDIYLINKSTILISYTSQGNGGISGYNDFVYAINDNHCKEIYIDVASAYRHNKMLLPKKIKEINRKTLHNYGYQVVIEDEKYILVYKHNVLIHKKKINEEYFNIKNKDGEIFYNK